jgi:hypothetical protein
MAAAALMAHHANTIPAAPAAVPSPVELVDEPEPEPTTVTYVPTTQLPAVPARSNGHSVGAGVIGGGVVR